MRIKSSIKNISVTIISQVVMILLGFISRKAFVDNLGIDYLGINAVMANVISMLSLVEGGLGTSIVFNLYKPLANRDEEKIIALVQLYKKVYRVIALIVFALSIALYSFIPYIIKDNKLSQSYIAIVFFIFVFKNMVSYIYAYKWSLIGADQKGYILSSINLIFNIITLVIKIIVLNIYKNYIIFLILEFVFMLIQNYISSRIVNKMYPYIRTKKKYKVENTIKNNIIKNVKAIFLHNIGTQCVFGTDNMLISAFVSVNAVGIYSNYNMLIGQLTSLVRSVIGGIGHSVGNLIATEGENKVYFIFKVTEFVNFIIYSICTICLYNLMNPFIELWLGKEFLLDKMVIIVLMVNFYMTGMRGSITVFKTKAGVFNEDKYMPLIEAAINLIASVILVKKLGLVGVFIGTTISSLAIPVWNRPRVVYKHVFKRPVREYFINYIMQMVITLLVGYITNLVCSYIIIDNLIISFLIKAITTIMIAISTYYILFRNTQEYIYLENIVKSIVKNIVKKYCKK